MKLPLRLVVFALATLATWDVYSAALDEPAHRLRLGVTVASVFLLGLVGGSRVAIWALKGAVQRRPYLPEEHAQP